MFVSETSLPNALVKVRGLTKAFGTNQVLMGVDLDVPKGSVVSIIGASGSGKTTLLRCVNLLETYDDGSIEVDGVGCRDEPDLDIRVVALELRQPRDQPTDEEGRVAADGENRMSLRGDQIVGRPPDPASPVELLLPRQLAALPIRVKIVVGIGDPEMLRLFRH